MLKARISTLTARQAYAAAFVLAGSLLGLRSFGRLYHAELWAEDGGDFLRYALERGFASFWVPLDGSFHTVQRAIILLVTKTVPFAWIPHGIAWSCLVVYAAIAASWVRDDLAWIFPNRWQRFLLCGLMVVAPGLNEMVGNLSNLNWAMFIWLATIGLKDPRIPIRKWELALSALIVTSLGTSLFLIPLFLWRFWIRRRDGAKAWVTPETLLVAFIVGWLGVIMSAELQRPRREILDPLSSLELLGGFFSRTAMLRSWFGYRITTWLIRDKNIVTYAIVVILMLTLTFNALRKLRHDRAIHAILALGVGLIVWPIACWYTRVGVIEYFEADYFVTLLDHRYIYGFAVFAQIFWLALLVRTPMKDKTRVVLLCFWIFVQPFLGMHRWLIKSYGDEHYWESSRTELERSVKTGCPATIQIPIYPEGWSMTYTSPKPSC